MALRIRDLLADLGLDAWVKTSGGLGLHVFVPLNSPVSYEQTKGFAHAMALLLEREQPEAVTSVMARARRPGKVFVDWSQNDFGKSTVAPYSLRGLDVPTASTPVTWEEVSDAAASGEVRRLRFLAHDVVPRAEEGDLFAPVLSLQQALPTFPAPGPDVRPARGMS
ncbi:MAG: hypothetical protein M3203_04235 [Actinomycetota bacterium]|nr:hypothetical protein [Actinomycetota bacterium]